MYWGIVADLLLAVLAVFGGYVLLRMLFLSCLVPMELGVILDIKEQTRAEDVPLLVRRARERAVLVSSLEIKVLAFLNSDCEKDEELCSALEKNGVTLLLRHGGNKE